MPPFWEQPLESLNAEEWEALCDGCGRCCLQKLEDEDSGAIIYTCLACRLLDCSTGHCSDYTHRHQRVPDCLAVDLAHVAEFDWLPPTCAYRLRLAGEPLPDWHPLLSQDPMSVQQAGISVAGRVINEDDAPDLPWIHFLVDWPNQWP